jgi:potassium efflux system protein
MKLRTQFQCLARLISLRILCWALISTIVLLSASQVLAKELSSQEFSSREAIAQRLETVQAELRENEFASDLAARNLLLQLEAALYQHQEALDYLAKMNQEAENSRQALSSWSGLDETAPYSIVFADQLRAEQQSLQRELLATGSRLRIANRAIEDTNIQLAKHQRAQRQFRETADNAGTAAARREAEQAARREELAARFLAETLARMRLRRDSQSVQELALKSALELNTLKIDAVRGKVQFTREELDAVQQRVAEDRSALLASVISEKGGEGSQGQQLTWKIDILDIERDFWNALYVAHTAGQEADRSAALASIKALKSRADDWVELIRLQIGDLADQETQPIGARVSLKDIRRVMTLQNQIDFALAELGDEGVRGPGVLAWLTEVGLAIWGAELYLAEETTSIGGEKVTTSRAVTLGKILRLAVILVVGWFLLRFLSRRVHSLVARRPNIDPGIADSARGWTFGLGLALLVLYGLNRVHIPFTAFAFLGGTLAIGIGFGAQTLLKNFISGVILSLERPFKVGDLVEVDNILGTIRHIGLRASVIHHFDGTDTLVPNSSLLESRVSNWTYGDTAMRGRVEVGVAYGSPTREVSSTLLAAADAHGLVLKDPAPSVQFSAFGDSALQFSLLFWFDARRTGREPLASDLRFMIDKSFAEAGTVIAFPQHDIHFDNSKPLRVELLRTPGTAGKEPAAD